MARRSAASLVATFVVSLIVAIALLVTWVVYVIGSVSRIEELAGRVGVSGTNSHWIVLAVGCTLMSLLIVGLSYQLAQALAAQRASRNQEEFVSNVTHELKSPVAAIKLHAQTLEQPDLTAAERASSIAYILEHADRVASLVDDMLESSRLLARRQRLALEPLDLRAFLDGYLAEARVRVERQGLRLTTRIDTRAVVLATGEALRRVLDNLIDNAVAHSHHDGEVRCLAHDDGGSTIIQIEDDGVGIPKGELNKIFDRFYRIGREIRGRRRSTGLGLSIVSGLVGELGGTVRAISQEGRAGARFVVRLPQGAPR